MTGDHLFVISATCLVLSCFDVSDGHHKPLSVMCVAFCSDNCLAYGQSVCTHEVSFVCFVTNLVIIIFLTLLSERIQEKRKIVTVFVGSCLVSVHSIPSRTVYTERNIFTSTHPSPSFSVNSLADAGTVCSSISCSCAPLRAPPSTAARCQLLLRSHRAQNTDGRVTRVPRPGKPGAFAAIHILKT